MTVTGKSSGQETGRPICLMSAVGPPFEAVAGFPLNEEVGHPLVAVVASPLEALGVPREARERPRKQESGVVDSRQVLSRAV